jgi:hypothetical protein
VVKIMKFFVYNAVVDGKKRNYLALLKPRQSFNEGMAEEAIIGEVLSDREITAANFVPNRTFLDLFHRVIGREMMQEPECIAEAQQLGNGWVYMIDRRADRTGNIAPDNIIGGMKVEKGLLVKDSYTANPRYALINEKGFFQLPSRLSEALLQAVTPGQ